MLDTRERDALLAEAPGAVARAADALSASSADPKGAALALVRAHPDEHGPVLLFTELCDRSGNRTRAEFVRDAVACARCRVPLISVPEGEFSADPDAPCHVALAVADRPPLGAHLILAPQVTGDPERHAKGFRARPVRLERAEGDWCYLVPTDDAEAARAAERLGSHMRAGFQWFLSLRDEYGVDVVPYMKFGLLIGLECRWPVWRGAAHKLCAGHPIRFVKLVGGPLPTARLAADWPGVRFEV